MPRHPRLQKRGSRYFLRVKVPSDLRSAIGKREMRKALGTADPREALKRVRKASVEADAVFETYRVRTAPNASDRVPASEADLERLALQAFQASERQNLATFLQTQEGDFEEILSGLRDDESVYRGGLSPVILRSLEKKADELKAAAETRAREFRGAAETAWTDARSKARHWQSEGEAYVRENPTKAILMAVGAGFVLGLLLKK